MNAYESGKQKVIPAVLVYLRHQGDILMVHRNRKPGDYHEGKWNGLGGKMDPGESPIEAARRELEEEAGLNLAPERFHNLGVLHFPDFKSEKHEDWLVVVFTADVTEAEARSAVDFPCPEGKPEWIAPERLFTLNLWEGDRHFLPRVLARTPFFATHWYEGERLVRHEAVEFGQS
jgi:8-oxo-dGTP diphosphatase